MITITWYGEFEKLGQTSNITLEFTGEDIVDVYGQINEYITSRDDNGFENIVSKILDIK